MQASSSEWGPVAGAPQVEIFPLTNKPSIVTSNAYILRTPFEIIIVDPGASAQQTERISVAVSDSLRERPRPVFVVLTHAHHDHSQDVEKIRLPEGTIVKRLAHDECVKILERGDRWLTVAYLYPDVEVCRAKFDLGLFPVSETMQPDERTVDLGDGVSCQLRTDVLETGGGFQVPRQSVQLGTGDWLEFYHTPGHSPDHLSIRLGRHLIIGDLPFAASPGLAGLVGWNQGDLLRSLRDVLWLLDTSDIEICHPGHGKAFAAAAMKKVLGAMENDARPLVDIAVIDPERIQALKEYALELLEEAHDLFTIIAGRLMSLSHKLTRLEEAQYGEKVMASLDFEAIDRTLTGFRAFSDAFRSGQQPDLSVALKGAQVVNDIERVFAGQRESPFISASLTSRAGRLLGDFMNTVRGLCITTNVEPLDVNELVEGIVQALTATSYDPAEIREALEDDAAYLGALATRLAMQPKFHRVKFDVEPSPRPVAVSVDQERVCDAIASLLESITGAGIKHVRIQTRVDRDHVEVQIASEEPLHAEMFGARKLNLYDRLLAVNSGGLRLRDDGGAITVNLLLPAA